MLNLAPERAAEYRRLMVAEFAKAQEKSGVPLGSGTIDVYGPASWVVRDVEGRETVLPGPGHRLPEEERLLPVPESYLRDLEARVNAPLTHELARRHPRLAGIARPVVRPMRRLASLARH
jgi:hypothetical protein